MNMCIQLTSLSTYIVNDKSSNGENKFLSLSLVSSNVIWEKDFVISSSSSSFSPKMFIATNAAFRYNLQILD